ncbi:Yip1 family protein [Simiduia curdlanivorans]|uniref:Yip1 family protein n=1 Tax=Simiduia curdlanivorans TaxID=1492769 RepID=A0ABV8V6P8_9GAMM|nr:Yip1 family protein [Simiduia curdlanivorans]MDN3638943.1 Yip1 family protein [Simiduia curdlanivorans]
MALLEHTLGILLHPDQEWKAIRNERHSFAQVFFSHVPILALIPPVAAFIGVTQVGWTIGDGDVVKLTVESALSLCIMTYIALMVGVYVLGEFINWMAKTYGVTDSAEKRHYEGTALAVYITTPVFLAGIAGIYPELWLNAVATILAGCYAVYLVYEGIPILMNIDKERAFMYATSVVTVGLVMLVIVRVGTVIVWGMGIGPVYVD